LNDGIFHIAGGANLRGYTSINFKNLAAGQTYQYNFVTALNSEFEFPNPVNGLLKDKIYGDFVHLRTYFFGDIGFFKDDNFPERGPSETLYRSVNRTRSDAGIGIQFSMNIPDWLGKDRGLAIRYEVPLWLSHPSGEKSFKFRNLVGIGAVISL
jgi:hypothetical protein